MSAKTKSFIVGSIAFVFYMMMRDVIPVHNMLFFVVACAIYAGVTIVAYCFFKKRETDFNLVHDRIWNISTMVLVVLWLILFYINEPNAPEALNSGVVIRRFFPFPLWILLMIAGTGICLFLLRKTPKDRFLKIRKMIRLVVSLLFTFGTSIQFYAPNIFLDTQGGTYHSHAYTNSIINVCWMTPYSKHLETLYGHYAIIFMPVVKFLHKFFHLDYLTGIFITCAAIMGIAILLFLYVLNYFAKSDLIFYLGMLGIGEEYFMLQQGGVYLQVHPHRMIFPMLMVAFALWESKRKKKHNILAIVIITLSIVWSTEVGMVVACAFALYRWCQHILDGEKLSFRKILILVREVAIYAVLPMAFAYLIVCAYNLLVGGEMLSFMEFMYPVLCDRNYVTYMEASLPGVLNAWVGASVLFMSAVIPAILRIVFPKKDEDNKKSFLLLIGVMSFGVMLYYINGAAENCLFITIFFVMILLAAVLQKCQDTYLNWKTNKESILAKPNLVLTFGLRIITVFIMFILAFDCVYSMPSAWKKSAESIWKRDELIEFAQHLYYQIPPDAISFGEGVPELMSLIDRDTHLHTTEWSVNNMQDYTMKKVVKDLEGQQWFFCSLYSLHNLGEHYPGLTDGYELHEEFDYNGDKFAFFVKQE